MISPSHMQAGLERLGRTFEHAIDRELVADYHEVLGALMDNATWERAVLAARRTCRFFPKPAELLELAGGARETAVRDAALVVFDGIWSLRKYPGAGPASWSRDEIRARYGEHGLRAFLASGAEAAWSRMDAESEPWVRKAFAAAYVERAASLPASALALRAAPERKLLPVVVPVEDAPDGQEIMPASEAEALELLRKIGGGQLVRSMPLARAATMTQPARELSDAEHAARIAELQAQAAARQGQQEPAR